MKFLLTTVFFFFLLSSSLQAQEEEKIAVLSDTTIKDQKPVDSLSKAKARIQNPKIAARRSAILPGWGQIYNKKYWKVPIVYGALGTAAGIFVYNHSNYRDLRQAYRGKYNARVLGDSSEYFKIKPFLLPLSEESLRFNRDQFRRNMDYSVLFFLVLWGLNVVDATVDAHLKSFDVSPDLSLQVKPGRSEMAGTNGLSLVLHIGK